MRIISFAITYFCRTVVQIVFLTLADFLAFCRNENCSAVAKYCSLITLLWLLYIEPGHVQNFTVIIVNETYVQLFWLAGEQAKQYTVFWRDHNEVCTAVGFN